MKFTSEIVSRGEAIELSVLTNVGVAVVKFDAKDSRVNVLSSAVMTELESVLALLQARMIGKRRIFGVVFSSGKPDSFIVGADIKEIVKAQELPQEVAFAGSQKGKEILAKIGALSIPTVAAIHGRCLGGGAELALACRERVATICTKTVIGLPEVGLGVLPGWGGTVKAPQLVGFASSLPLILNPLAPWSATRAWQAGLISEAVEEGDLYDRAVALALGGPPRCAKPSFLRRTLRNIFDSSIGRAIASTGMKLAINAKTRGKLPAPAAALKVMNAAFELPEAAARELESETFASLCKTSACKTSVQKFLDHQKAKKAKTATTG